MRPIGSGWILKSNTVSAVECLHYALNLPTSVVITGCDSLAVLNQALDAARIFKPLGQTQLEALLMRTAIVATKESSRATRRRTLSTGRFRIRSGSDKASMLHSI